MTGACAELDVQPLLGAGLRPLDRLLDCAEFDGTDEPAIGRRYESALQLVFEHVVSHLLQRDVGPEGARAQLHRLLDARCRILLERLSTQPAEHDLVIIHDGAAIGVKRSLAHISEAVRQKAGWHFTREAPDAVGGQLPFCGQAGGGPVLLAAGVIVDLREAEAFEPPRGPRAQVSLEVETVDDDGAITLRQPRRRFGVELLQWQVDGVGQMLFVVLRPRQHLDELRTFTQEPLDFIATDVCGHRRVIVAGTGNWEQGKTPALRRVWAGAAVGEQRLPLDIGRRRLRQVTGLDRQTLRPASLLSLCRRPDHLC